MLYLLSYCAVLNEAQGCVLLLILVCEYIHKNVLIYKHVLYLDTFCLKLLHVKTNIVAST